MQTTFDFNPDLFMCKIKTVCGWDGITNSTPRQDPSMSGKHTDFAVQWKRFFLIVGAFLALILLLYLRFSLSRQAEEAPQKHLPVRTVPAVAENVKLYDTVLGKVEGGQSVRVLAGSPGFVVEVRKSRGDGVANGEVVIVLEDSGLLYKLREAEGLFSSAKSDLEEAERKYRQYERLFDKGVVSKDDLDSGRSAYLKASSQFEALEASYRRAKWDYDRLKVRSPLSGTVVEIFPDAGQEVMRGETVARVAGGGKNKVVARVDSSTAKRTARGGKVLIEYKTPEGKRSASGTVTGVSKEADDNSTTYSVEVAPDGGELGEELWSGEFVNLRIESGLLSEVVRIPATALLYDGKKPFAFVVHNGRARRVALKGDIVWTDPETAAVAASNFPEGSQIITEGNSRLHDGQAVSVPEDG